MVVRSRRCTWWARTWCADPPSRAHATSTLDALDAVTDLPAASASLAGRLLRAERVTLLVPLRADRARPSWLAPASRDGAQNAGFPDRGAYLDHLRLLHADGGAAPAVAAREA